MSRAAFVAASALALALLASGCGSPGPVERVILVTVDTTRADRLGCYGYADAQTPHLDALAAEGVVFENAISVVPTTLPAHSSIFTGRYPQDHGVRYNLFRPLGPEEVTLAETLAEAGFRTAGFPASQIVHSRYGLNQGFEHWVEPPESIDRDVDNPVRSADRIAGEGVDLALEWLRDNPGGRHFVWLHLYDPHFSYDPPFPFNATFRDRPYDGEIAYMDEQLGRLFDALRADARWDRTAVIVVGDHGEGLYDHDERWHTMLLYETTQHVPLIVRVPGGEPRRVPEPVSHVDLAPTVLELVGVAPQGEMRGASLVAALGGDPLPRRDVYFETMAGSMSYGWQELRGLRAGDWKLIDAASGSELFDLSSDPTETTDLSGANVERLGELRAALERMAAPLGGETTEQGAADAAPALDPETEALLISLGYATGDSGGAAAGAPHPRTMIDLEPELLAAQTAVARGNWSSVHDLGDYTLKRDPSNRWALGAMVEALIAADDLDGAAKHAELFSTFYPELPRAVRLHATVAMARSDPGEAYRLLEAGLEQHPESEDLTYLAMVAGFDAGVEGVCRGRVQTAVDRFEASGRMAILRARCEAADGMVDEALASLGLARERGFRSLDFLLEQPEFADVSATDAFAALLEDDAGGDSPPS